jgi:hypothetical protein
MPKVTAQQVLNAPIGANDANAATVREYLLALLALLWDQRAGFDAKRPLGLSDWEEEVYRALVLSGLVEGRTDNDGALETVDEATADRLVADAIRSLSTPTRPEPG